MFKKKLFDWPILSLFGNGVIFFGGFLQTFVADNQINHTNKSTTFTEGYVIPCTHSCLNLCIWKHFQHRRTTRYFEFEDIFEWTDALMYLPIQRDPGGSVSWSPFAFVALPWSPVWAVVPMRANQGWRRPAKDLSNFKGNMASQCTRRPKCSY